MDSGAPSGQKRTFETIDTKNEDGYSAGGNGTSSNSNSETASKLPSSSPPKDQPTDSLDSDMCAEDPDEKGQMERKRHREKKRRSEITHAVERLSTTMNKIDPSRTEGRRLKAPEDGDQNNTVTSSNSLHPPTYRSLNRTEIISNACDIMERLNEENQKLKEQVRILTGAGACPPPSNNGIVQTSPLPSSLLGVAGGAMNGTQQQQLQNLQQPNSFGLLSLQSTIRNSQEQAAEIERQQLLVQQLLHFPNPQQRPSSTGGTSAAQPSASSSTPAQAQLQQLRQMQQLQQAQAQVAHAFGNAVSPQSLMTRQALSQQHTTQLLQMHLMQQQQQQQQQNQIKSQSKSPSQSKQQSQQSESKETSSEHKKENTD